MKKMIFTLLATFWLAFSVQAALLNGTFADPYSSPIATSISVTGKVNLGWTAGFSAATNVSGVATFTSPDTATSWFTAIAQVWTDTLTGFNQLKIGNITADVASLTAPILHIEILEFAPATLTSKMRVGFPANDVKISSLGEWRIDLTTVGSSWISPDIDFTGKSGLYGIRMSFEATADAGDNDNLMFDNVSIDSAILATNPVLVASGTVATNSSGKFWIAQTYTATVTIANSGAPATNVTAQLVLPAGDYFTISPSTNLSFGNVAASAGTNITLIAATNTPPGTYSFLITNINCDAAGTGFTNTPGSFNLTISQGVTVSGQTNNAFILPSANINTPVTNTSMVISNSTIIPLVCTFTHSAPWLTRPLSGSSITIPARSSTVVTQTGFSAVGGTFSNDLAVTYDQVVTNFTSFAVLFSVGPKISYQANRITESTNLFGGVANGLYEPGERLIIVVSNINDGALVVDNVTNSLANTSGLFTITPLSSQVYASMTVGAVRATYYQVDISASAPNGPQTFTVVNSSEYGAWTSSFTLAVSSGIYVSPNELTIHVPAGGIINSNLTLNNSGNSSTTFKLTDNGIWPVSYSVATQTASLVSFPPIYDAPNPANTFTNWSGNSSVLMNIGFNFPLYGTAYSTFSVSRYGAVSFGTTVGANTSFTLPSGSSPLAAPFWGNTAVGTNSVRYQKMSDKLVVAWGNRTGHEFQAWLYTNGNIRYLYEQTTWGAGAIGIQDSSNSLNAAYTPGNGSESVLLTPRSTPWVTYSPTNGTLNALSSRSITYTANASGQSAGTTNIFNATVTWGDGSTSVVAVKVVVGGGSPGLDAPTDVPFTGPAGFITKTNMLLVNTGDVSLAYTITDTGAQSAGYKWTNNTTFNWDNSHWDANSVDAVAILNGDDKTGWLPIGFGFPFYGNVYTQFLIDVNGGVGLSLDPLVVLAPFPGVTLDANAKIRYSGNANHLVVTWENVRLAGGGNDQTFQAILFKDSTIRFQYQTLSGSNAWPAVLIGLADEPRATVATLVYPRVWDLPGTVEIATNVLVTTNGYHTYTNTNGGFVYTNDIPILVTNITIVTNYDETVTDEAIVFTPANPIIITVDPANGTLPVNATNVVTISGDARGLTPGGTNNVFAATTFGIKHLGLIPGTNVTTNVVGGVTNITTNLVIATVSTPVSVMFLATNSADIAFDADADGMSDLKEILAGTDESNAESVFGVAVTQNANGSRAISWPAATDNLSRTYAVWYTTNLLGGWTEELYRGDNFTSYTDTAHANVPVIYYKVTVQ